jgi:hypothetical protein
MRRHFESDLSGDERNAETDHKDDKFQKNYPTKQEKYDTPRDQQNKLELPKKASKSKKGSDSDYTLETWFERDRKHVELLHKGETVCDWWDDAVDEMVEDGFLNPKDWLGSAIEYAKAHGLIKSASFKSRLAARHKMADEGMPVNEEPETSEEIPSEKPAPVEEAPKVEETPAEPTGDVNDWVQKVMDYKSEQEHDELVDALLEACDAVGVPEEQTDAVVEKVMQDSGLEVDDLAVEETGLETTEPIQSPEPVAEESEEEPTERNEEIDHEACDKTADAEPEVHEAKGPLTEENQLVKVKNLMEQASKILGENKDALLNSNNPGADAHMDAVDGILETLAHSPISEMSSNSTVEQIKSVMGILMELQGEFPGELKGIGEAVRLCNEAYKALTSFRSSFGMTSADKRGSKQAHRLNVGDVITCSQCGHPLYSDNSKVKDPASYGTPLSHYDNIVCDMCADNMEQGKPVDTESEAPSFNDTTRRWSSCGDHEACDKTADAEPEVHEAKGPLTEENQLVKVKNLMEQASKILGENKDALLNSNNPGADAHMDAVDGILETLAHSPISEMSSNSTVEQIKSVMGILMELQGEFPGELKGIGEAVRLCNEAYKALTSFRSSFGMTSADKTADEMPEVEGDGGEQDRFKSRASELLAAHDQELPEDVTDWLMQIAENGIDGVSKEATVDLCKRYDGVNEMLPEDIFDFTVDVADALEISDEDLDFPEDLDNDPESDIQGTLPENDIVGEEDRSFNQNMTPNTGM